MIGFLANVPGYDVQPMVDLFLENSNVGTNLKKKMKKQAQAPAAPQGTQTVLPPEGSAMPEPNVTDFSELNNPLA